MRWFKKEIASFVGRSNPLIKEKVTYSEQEIPLYQDALLQVEKMVKNTGESTPKKQVPMSESSDSDSSDSEMEDVPVERRVNPLEGILMGIQV